MGRLSIRTSAMRCSVHEELELFSRYE
jgi:hypothetical protein